MNGGVKSFNIYAAVYQSVFNGPQRVRFPQMAQVKFIYYIKCPKCRIRKVIERCEFGPTNIYVIRGYVSHFDIKNTSCNIFFLLNAFKLGRYWPISIMAQVFFLRELYTLGLFIKFTFCQFKPLYYVIMKLRSFLGGLFSNPI